MIVIIGSSWPLQIRFKLSTESGLVSDVAKNLNFYLDRYRESEIRFVMSVAKMSSTASARAGRSTYVTLRAAALPLLSLFLSVSSAHA